MEKRSLMGVAAAVIEVELRPTIKVLSQCQSCLKMRGVGGMVYLHVASSQSHGPFGLDGPTEAWIINKSAKMGR